MNINIWNIHHWLAMQDIAHVANISEGVHTLDAAVTGAADPAANRSHLLIVSSYTVSNQQKAGAIFKNGDDSIIFPDLEIEDAYNLALKAFAYFHKWECTLFQAAVQQSSYQDLIDLASQVIPIPMLIANDSGTIFAISSRKPSSSYGGHWRDFEYSRFLTQGLFAVFPTIQSEDFLYETIQKCRSRFFDCNIYFFTIKLKKRGFLVLAAFDFDGILNPGHIQVFQSLIYTAKTELTRTAVSLPSSTALGNYLISCIKRNRINPNRIQPRLKQLQWNMTDSYQLLCLQIPVQEYYKQEALLDAIALEDCCSFLSSENIFLLVNLTKNPAHLSGLLQSSCLQGLPVGISNEFRELSQFLLYHKQCRLALQHACDNQLSVVHIKDLSMRYICSCLGEQSFLRTLIHPKLLKLQAHDRQYDTKYMETLYVYLLCGRNSTDASLHLNSHRNTVVRHIEEIKEILHFDPKNIQEATWILFSYFILFGTDSLPIPHSPAMEEHA